MPDIAFRTALACEPITPSFALKSPVLTVGSCFADTIGQRLLAHKFEGLSNPFGVIFNPLSVHKLLSQAIAPQPELWSAPRFVQQDGLWLHYDWHSEHYAANKDTLIQQLQQTLHTVAEVLQKAQWIVYTFGTAWVYRLRTDHTLVANCHKSPAANFEKQLLSVAEIVADFAKLHTLVAQHNPRLHWLLTVSPVRHLKDTLPLNSVSKSVLRLACHELSQNLAQVHYFPAYELLLDDLRDYRFYAQDMLHPSEQAQEYIWQQFAQAAFNPETQAAVRQWSKIRQALQHRPLCPESVAHQQFLQNIYKQVEAFGRTNDVDVAAELNLLSKQL
jgi:hypothetical protein